MADGAAPPHTVVRVEGRIVRLVERGKCSVDAAVMLRVGQLGHR